LIFFFSYETHIFEFIIMSFQCVAFTLAVQSADHPNILWISCEDLSPYFNFYGDRTIATPQLDRLAQEGVVYNKAFASASVCAPSRCAIITGVNQVTAGGHNMRTLYHIPEQTGLPKSLFYCSAAGDKSFSGVSTGAGILLHQQFKNRLPV
jgi:N-sulfoglucosamine sulfohydrolase